MVGASPDQERRAGSMTVAVLAATGSTGSLVVEQLLARGHSVVAVSRSAIKDPKPGERFRSMTGDMTDSAFMALATAQCDAIITCVGQNRKSKSLWAATTSPPDILSKVTRAVLAAVGTTPKMRLIYMSAFGVGEDLHKHSFIFRMILSSSSIKTAYKDHAIAEDMIRKSALDWTIVKPPGLTDKDEIRVLIDKGDKWSSFATVSKKSVAAFLVGCVEDHSFSRKSVTIGEPK